MGAAYVRLRADDTVGAPEAGATAAVGSTRADILRGRNAAVPAGVEAEVDHDELLMMKHAIGGCLPLAPMTDRLYTCSLVLVQCTTLSRLSGLHLIKDAP